MRIKKRKSEHLTTTRMWNQHFKKGIIFLAELFGINTLFSPPKNAIRNVLNPRK